MDEIESWLTDSDLQRLWDVCHGILPQVAASEDELAEFERVVMHAAMIKMGGTGYTTAILQ
jgi:hypothetical protein